jgi:flagellar motor switch protein FliM
MDVLDQSSIDALLAAVETSDVKEDAPKVQVFSRGSRTAQSADVREYDFKRPERVSKDQMRALQTLHEGFARNFGAALSGFLRTIVEVKVAACEQMTYSEFTSGLPNPTSFNLLASDGLEGQMCLEISPLIIYPIVDRLLGGNSQDLFIPQRPMTAIETRLISNVTRRGLEALSEAWGSIKAMQFSITTSESNPQLVQIVPPNEVVVVIAFELKMGNRAGTMNLCIPYNVIEPMVEQLSSQNWFTRNKHTRSKETEQQLVGNLSAAPLEVIALLAQTTITVQDLLAMSVGDIIVTQTPHDKPVTLSVEGENKFTGNIGQFRGNRAVRIR